MSMYLEDIERIRQLKYRYFRGIDTADIELLRGVLAEDVHIDYHGGTYRWQVEGREAMLASIAAAFNEYAVACHTGHHPEIEVLTPTSATGGAPRLRRSATSAATLSARALKSVLRTRRRSSVFTSRPIAALF